MSRHFAVCSIHNPRIPHSLLRISGGRKSRSKTVIVAVMRKLLVMAWAMLRDGQIYQARPAASETAA